MMSREGSLDALLHSSTGCVYEGIIHAYEIAKRNMDLDNAEKLEAVIHKGMCNLLGFQVWFCIPMTLLGDMCAYMYMYYVVHVHICVCTYDCDILQACAACLLPGVLGVLAVALFIAMRFLCYIMIVIFQKNVAVCGISKSMWCAQMNRIPHTHTKTRPPS